MAWYLLLTSILVMVPLLTNRMPLNSISHGWRTVKTALLRVTDKKEVSADEAAIGNELRAFCPDCKQPVRLHRSKKIANHFEHESRTGRCSRHYRC